MKHIKRPPSRFLLNIYGKYSKNRKEHLIWENPFKTRKIVTTVSLVFLPLILFTLYHVYTLASSAAINASYDVVVVGGGTGGVSAAVQAARQGVRVALVEQTDWLGGQAAAAGVSNMDEGANERASGIYNEFVSRLATKYGGLQYIHKCYFGGNNICPEPHIVKQVFEEMVASTGRIDVYYRHTTLSVLKSGNTVTGITTHSAVDNSTNTINGKVVIDATEYGDVLPLAGVAYRVGSQTSGNISSSACIQDITYPAVVKRYDGGVPSYLRITTPPPGYDSTVESRFAEMVTNSNPQDNGSAPYYWSWIHHNAYRGMADSSRPSTSDAGSNPGSITKTGINFANDYPSERPYTSSGTRLSVSYIEDKNYRTQANCEAKLKTIQFLYYMQKQGMNWSVADDEGFDTAYNQSENSCSNIPAAFKEIEKRLPVAPYVRESRRMIGITTYTSSQLRAQKQVNKVDGAAVKGVNFSSSIAVGGYDDDLHNCNDASSLDGTVDSIGDKGMGGGPFQIPIEALIPQSVDGFLAAEKNISQSRLVNGATRLQPITMLTGQAAGALAAISAQSGQQPRTVRPIDVQLALANTKNYLALAQFNDVTPGNTYFTGVQISSLYNIFFGDGSGNFSTGGTVSRGTGAILMARLFGIQTNGSEDDAVTRIRMRGYSTASSNGAYNAGGTLTKGDLAVLIARALGQNPGNSDNALSYLTSQSIPVECGGGGCANDVVTRGIFANVAAYTLHVQGTTIPQPPVSQGNPASNLQANVQSSQVSLSWTQSSGTYMNRDGSDSDHIQVYSNSNFTGTKVLDGGVGGGTQNWNIPVNTSGSYNSVQPGRTYYARIYSWNAPCNCSDGTTTSFTIPSAPQIEGDSPASNITITAQASTVSLSWTPSTGIYTNRNFSDHDHIQVYSNSNFTGTKVLDGGVGAGIQNWNIPVNTSGSYNSVQPGRTYYARIYSFNAPCNCSDGTSGSFTVPGGGGGNSDRAAANLQANVQGSQVSLSWNQSSGSFMNRDGSDSDHIQVYSNPNFTGTKVLDGGVGGGKQNWNIPINTSGSYNSVQPGRTYYARIYSWNAPCNCNDGTTTSFTVTGATSDQPATNVQASVQSTQVLLTWTASTGSFTNRDFSDHDHIQVYTNADFTGEKVLDGGTGAGTTSWAIPITNSGAYNSLRSGTTYFARIYSWNAPCNCSTGTSISFRTP